MLVEILDLGLDKIFDKLRECWIWVSSSPRSPSPAGYDLGVLLDEILPIPGAGLQFVPEGGGDSGERVADYEEGWRGVPASQELVVLEVAGPGPDLGLYEGVVLPPAHRPVLQVGQHCQRHGARGDLRH